MELSDDLASENFAAQILNENLKPAESKDDIKKGRRFYQKLDTDQGRVVNIIVRLWSNDCNEFAHRFPVYFPTLVKVHKLKK